MKTKHTAAGVLNGILLGAAILGLPLLAGCLTPKAGGRESVAVSVTGSGRAFFSGSSFPVAELGRRLKNAGIPTSTHLEIAVPSAVNQSVVQNAGRSLSSAGYRIFVFMKPKEAVSTVGSHTNRIKATSSKTTPQVTPSGTRTSTNLSGTATQSGTNFTYVSKSTYATNNPKITTNWLGGASNSGVSTKSSAKKSKTGK